MASRISKRDISKDTIIRISSIARFLPAQFAGPKEKGMKAAVLVVTVNASLISFGLSRGCRCSPFSHRSGQNTSGFGEKYVSQRCKEYAGILIVVPGGTNLKKLFVNNIKLNVSQIVHLVPRHFPALSRGVARCMFVGRGGAKRKPSFLLKQTKIMQENSHY